MSNDKDDDLKILMSVNIDQTKKIDDCEVIHKSPPSYGFINPKAMQNDRQLHTKPSTIHQNEPGTQLIFLNNNMSHKLRYNKGDTDHVREYTGWSLFNTICCCLCLGIWAMIMSHKTQEKKRKGDLDGAKEASKTTAILNISATIIGLILVTLFILRTFGYIPLPI